MVLRVMVKVMVRVGVRVMVSVMVRGSWVRVRVPLRHAHLAVLVAVSREEHDDLLALLAHPWLGLGLGLEGGLGLERRLGLEGGLGSGPGLWLCLHTPG